MNLQRILAVVLIVLIGGCFAAMVTALFRGNFNLFFIIGGVLVGLFILGWLLLKAVRGSKEKETDDKKE